jgi:hypothetical protein
MDMDDKTTEDPRDARIRELEAQAAAMRVALEEIAGDGHECTAVRSPVCGYPCPGFVASEALSADAGRLAAEVLRTSVEYHQERKAAMAVANDLVNGRFASVRAALEEKRLAWERAVDAMHAGKAVE